MFAGIMQVVGPVYLNTYWVANALGLCEGAWKHAEELNPDHGHFFSIITKYALDAAVLGICKLYDSSNPKRKKDTILNLAEHLKCHLDGQYAGHIDAELLVRLGTSEQLAQEVVAGFRGVGFIEARDKLFASIDQQMPRPLPGTPLHLLLTHRNERIAHQDQLATSTVDVTERLKFLPSLDEMERLNNWATAFCELIVRALSDETLGPHSVSARIATLNVVAKVLGKNFDRIHFDGAAYQEWQAFYARL